MQESAPHKLGSRPRKHPRATKVEHFMLRCDTVLSQKVLQAVMAGGPILTSSLLKETARRASATHSDR